MPEVAQRQPSGRPDGPGASCTDEGPSKLLSNSSRCSRIRTGRKNRLFAVCVSGWASKVLATHTGRRPVTVLPMVTSTNAPKRTSRKGRVAMARSSRAEAQHSHRRDREGLNEWYSTRQTAASRMAGSAVINVRSRHRAVATMARSKGSPWKPGGRALEMGHTPSPFHSSAGMGSGERAWPFARCAPAPMWLDGLGGGRMRN
jgi:hypothetical protein